MLFFNLFKKSSSYFQPSKARQLHISYKTTYTDISSTQQNHQSALHVYYHSLYHAKTFLTKKITIIANTPFTKSIIFDNNQLMVNKLHTSLRKEQIVEAALNIIIHQGINALTVRNVAAEVGVTASSLYRHYKNKAAIMSALLDLLFDMRANIITKARRQSENTVEILEDIYFSYIDLLEQYKGLALIYFSDFVNFEHPELGQRMRQDVSKGRRELAEIIENGKAQGQIAPTVDTEQLVISFICLYIMPSMLKSRNLHEFDLEKQNKANWSIFKSALA